MKCWVRQSNEQSNSSNSTKTAFASDLDQTSSKIHSQMLDDQAYVAKRAQQFIKHLFGRRWMTCWIRSTGPEEGQIIIQLQIKTGPKIRTLKFEFAAPKLDIISG